MVGIQPIIIYIMQNKGGIIMFNASEARAAAAANKFKKGILTDIESAINVAILDGDTECKVTIDPETPDEIIDEVIMTMEEGGYFIKNYIVSNTEKYFKISWEDAE